MKFQAKPVVVDAFRITAVSSRDEHGAVRVALDNGKIERADAGMVARFMPAPGDYWVVQSDGYAYLNPKDVFLGKYACCGYTWPTSETMSIRGGGGIGMTGGSGNAAMGINPSWRNGGNQKA